MGALFGVVFSVIFLYNKFDLDVYPFALLVVVVGITLVNLKKNKISRILINLVIKSENSDTSINLSG